MEPNPPSPPTPYIIIKGHVPWHGEPGYNVKGTRYTFRKRTILRSFFDRPRAQRWLTTEGQISVPSNENEEFMLEYWDWVDEQDKDARENGRVDSMDQGSTSVLADEGGLFRETEIEQEEQVIVPGLLSAMTNIIHPASRGSRRGHSNITRPTRPARARGQIQTHPVGPPPDANPNPYNYFDGIPHPPGRDIRRGRSGIIRPTRPENIRIPEPRQPRILIGDERPAWAGPPPNTNPNPYAYLDGYTPLPQTPFTGYVPPRPSGNLYRNPFLDEPYPRSQYTPPTFQPPLQAGHPHQTFRPLQAGYTPPTFQPPPQAGYPRQTFQQPPQAEYPPSTFQPPSQAGYPHPIFEPPIQTSYTPPNFRPLLQAGYQPPTFQPIQQAGYPPPHFQPPPQAGYTANSGPLPPQRTPPHVPSPLNPHSASFRPGTTISALGQGEHGRGMFNVLNPDSARRRRQERWEREAEETDERDEPGNLGKRQR